MLVNCPICSDIILPSDVLNSTPCGHIFHKSCLDRWLERNTTCPQCRQECKSNIHRIYLPEVNYQDPDQLIERMNDINKQKIEFEAKLKKIEHDKKALENELKKKKKEFHRVMQRNLRKKATANIPPRHLKNASANVFTAHTQAHISKNHTATSSTVAAQHPKKKRNASRVQRSTAYFHRKRVEQRNNNNNNNNSRVSVEVQAAVVDLIADSPAISVSSGSDDTISSN